MVRHQPARPEKDPRMASCSRPSWACLPLAAAMVLLLMAPFASAQTAPALAPTTAPATVTSTVTGAPAAASLLIKLVPDDFSSRKKAIDELVHTGDQRLISFFEAYSNQSVYNLDGKIVVGLDTTNATGQKAADIVDPLTRAPVNGPDGKPLVMTLADLKGKDVSPSRREKMMLRDAANVIRLLDPDPVARLAAILKTGDTDNAGSIEYLQEVLKSETSPKIHTAIEESIARIQLEVAAKGLMQRYEAAQGKLSEITKQMGVATTHLREANQSKDPAAIAVAQAEVATAKADIEQVKADLKAAADPAKNPEEADALKARHAAVAKLGDLASLRAMNRVREIEAAEQSPEAQAGYAVAVDKIESWQTKVALISNLFSGVSRGSILIFVALGLAIIFGLMGVINMAHGELVMIGAYATYITQLAFQRWLPESAFDWYFVFAIPVSFIAAALVGMVIEFTVVRRLYGRPLDTLLATIGVGYVLIQLVRGRFGDNIGVKAPSWLQGGWEINADIILPYNRLFAIVFCIACILLTYIIINKTKLGLMLRATTQGRAMAGALGVPTKRIDLYTFAFGAGLAGLAGCALAPIEGVTPNMGSNYIIDSFLVVVTGGVGKLAGTIISGFGLGMFAKLIEPLAQAVWAYVWMLILVVVFIQFKPSGLFPAKGRLADV